VGKKKRKVEKKGKKPRKKIVKKLNPYASHKYCPKCGPGVALAEHKDRRSCGKCGYYEKK